MKGGRFRQNMTLEEKKLFLSDFKQKAGKGGVRVAKEQPIRRGWLDPSLSPPRTACLPVTGGEKWLLGLAIRTYILPCKRS